MLIKSCFAYCLTILFLLVNVNEAFVCTPDHCASVKCEPVNEEACKGPDKLMRHGGFCGCCNLCHTILGKGDDCPSLQSIILGLPPPTVQCGKGLTCAKGKCVLNSELVSDYS